MEEIKNSMEKIEGVFSLHDFHVWELVDQLVIASVHVQCYPNSNLTNIHQKIKKIFHRFGIHSSSIQLEFVPSDNKVSQLFSFFFFLFIIFFLMTKRRKIFVNKCVSKIARKIGVASPTQMQKKRKFFFQTENIKLKNPFFFC